jgi:hypothetical protein
MSKEKPPEQPKREEKGLVPPKPPTPQVPSPPTEAPKPSPKGPKPDKKG